jgi:hypothetical protein
MNLYVGTQFKKDLNFSITIDDFNDINNNNNKNKYNGVFIV